MFLHLKAFIKMMEVAELCLCMNEFVKVLILKHGMLYNVI